MQSNHDEEVWPGMTQKELESRSAASMNRTPEQQAAVEVFYYKQRKREDAIRRAENDADLAAIPVREGVDYRALLMHYMDHVIDCEGVSFVDSSLTGSSWFTVDEGAELMVIKSVLCGEE